MLVKLTKEQQLTVKRLFDRFKNNLSDKSYLKFRKRVHKAIGFNGEYDMRVLTIDEVNLTFGIETDGYGHTWSNYLLQDKPPIREAFFCSGFGIRDSGVFYMHMGVCNTGRTELQQIAALSLKKFLPGPRAAIKN